MFGRATIRLGISPHSSLIYNTNCNLFLWIEIFISTTDLYNTTANRWSCQLPSMNVCATYVLPMGVGPFAFRYQGNGATPCQYLDLDTTRKTIDCATTLTLTVFGSRPSDHYFRSVCLFVCLSVCLFVCAEFFSAVFDPISIKLAHMLYIRV